MCLSADPRKGVADLFGFPWEHMPSPNSIQVSPRSGSIFKRFPQCKRQAASWGKLRKVLVKKGEKKCRLSPSIFRWWTCYGALGCNDCCLVLWSPAYLHLLTSSTVLLPWRHVCWDTLSKQKIASKRHMQIWKILFTCLWYKESSKVFVSAVVSRSHLPPENTEPQHRRC